MGSISLVKRFDATGRVSVEPPDEPPVHHDGTRLLEGDGEDQGKKNLPSACSSDIKTTK